MKKYDHMFDNVPVIDSRDPQRMREAVEYLEVSLTYSKGGYLDPRRGWSLHVQPMSIVRPEPHVSIKRYSPTEGVRRFVHEVGRASAKGKRDAILAAHEVMDETVAFCLRMNPHLTVVAEEDEEVA